MKKTLTVVRYALVSLFSFLFIGSAMADAPTPSVVWYGANAKEAFAWGAKSGYTLSRDRVSTVAHEIPVDGSKITIANDNGYGVQIRPSSNYDAFSVLVKYNNFTPNSNGDTVIATARNPSAGNRIGFYVNSDGTKMRKIIGNVMKDTDGETNNAFPSSGEFCFVYDKGASTIKVYARATGEDDFTQIFSFTDNNSQKDTITIAGVRENNTAGAHNISGGTGPYNPVGMVIEGIALFNGSALSTSDAGSYVWPEGKPVIKATITAENVKVSDINGLSELATATSDDLLNLTLVGAKTLEFDAAFKCAECNVIFDGALKLLGGAAPADFAKFNFAGVTSLDYAWLTVGSGMAINFHSSGRQLGDEEESAIPDMTLYGKCWNNTEVVTGSMDAKLFGADGSTVISGTSISISWSAKNNYQNDIEGATPFLKGYLDDGTGVNIIADVPFGFYDVFIICSTDNGIFSTKTVNDTKYTVNANGEAVVVQAAAQWGTANQSTPTPGKNVMCVRGLTDHKLVINSVREDNGGTKGRGCIAAIVIVKAEPPAETVKATITEDTTWSALWAGGTALTANTPVELTFTGSATLTIDTEVVAKNIKLIGDTTAQVVGIAGTAANINAFLGNVTETTDFAGKFDYRFDATSGLTADSALLNMIKSASNDKIFTFIGSGENGVTFGSSSSTWNGTLSSHIVLNGGKHAIYWSNGNALFGTGASVDNPTLLLENNATMDFYGHDITGWSAYADDDNARLAGVIRVNNGSTLNMHRQGNGTVYYNQTFCIEGGAKITTDINGTDARMGGAKIVVPAQETAGDPAEIVCLSTGSGSLFFGKDIPKGAEFSIGANAKLKITGAVESLNGGNNQVAGGGDYPLKKTGEGVLEVTGNILAPVNVESGSLALGGSVRSIMFADDATLTSINAISLKDFSVASGKTLLLDATAGDIAITKAPTNNGTIKIVGGNVAFMPDTNVGTIVEEGGKAIYGYIVNINDCGKFTIPADKTAESIRLFDAAGNAVPFTDNKDGTVSYEWVVTGGVCWWDYEFEGNDNNDGTDGTRLSWDGGHPRSGAEYTEDGELYISSVPWRGGVNWPEKATFVMYGTMVGTDKTYQIGFGSTYQGQQPYNTIFLATDTVSENTVNLCICQAKNAPTVLCQMTVPNAQTAKHLYAFTLKTVEGKTVVDIYLDGELLQSYPFDSQIVLGSGFQIGSGHGGTCAGYERTAAKDEAVLDFLRVYKEDLSAEAHQKYAVLYPYVSPNGSYQRTVIAGADWSATDAWTKEGTEPDETADEPAAGATVKIAIDNDDATTTIAINLADNVTYEAIQINGDDVKFVLAEGEEFGGIAKSTGRVTANANITFAYDAFSMAGAPLTVKQGKTVTFDLSMVDMTKFFSTQTYDLTGYLTLEDGAKVTFIVPEDLHDRTASAAIDDVTKHYVLTVAAPDYAFVYENGKWTWGTQVVDEETINAHPEVLRSIKSDLEMALGAYNYSVENGATLTQTDASATGTITINEGGKFDVNGVVDTALKVVLNGGSLINDGSDIDTGKKQYVSITQAAASTIGGSGDFGYVLIGYGANTLDLSGATLTKTGDNTFSLCNATVQNGTLKIAAGTLATANRAVTIADTATIEGVEGAVLSVGSSISDFTLTGALKLAGAGTFGTITLDDDAALDIATVRGLTVAGEGTIKATITAAEMAGGSLTVFTKAEDATISTSSVTLYDEAGEVLSGYTADYDEDGNYIANFTVAVAIPTIAGTTVVVYAGEDELTPDQDGNVAVPYGADLFVTYIVEDGKVFKDGNYMVELEYKNVTTENIPDVQADVDDLEVIDDVVPEASAEKLDPIPEGMATAATFAVTEAGSENYADFTATFTITANKNVAQDAIVLAGQFNATNLEDPEGVNNNYDGEWIDMPLTSGLTTGEPYTVVSQPWKFVTEFVKTFNCGLKDVALAEDTSFTVTLTVYKEEFAVLEKEITLDVVAKKLPTADVTAVTVDGLDKAAMYELKDMGVGYEDWYADFTITLNKDVGAGQISLGGAYGKYGLTSFSAPEFKAGVPQKVMALYGDVKVTVAELDTIKRFVCGIKNNTFTENIDVTVQLVIYNDETTITIGNAFKTTVDAIKAIESVVPGEDIDIPDDKDPEEYAGKVEAQKATLLKAPVELVGEALTTYQSYFTAKVVGTKVAFVLNEAGEAVVEEAVKTVEADVLSVALSADTTEFTIAEPLKGFYYSLKQGGELTGLDFNDAGDKNKLGGKDEIKFTLVKPEGKGFYQTIVTPVEYK